MTATLSFNLDDPDDRRAHLCAVHSKELAISIWEIQYNLRKELEVILDNYEELHNTEDNLTERIWRLVSDKLPNVDIDELII